MMPVREPNMSAQTAVDNAIKYADALLARIDETEKSDG